MARITPYSYRPGNTILHRLPAGVKLLGLPVMSLAFLFSNCFALGSASCCIIVFSFLAGINPRELLRGSLPVFYMLIAVFVFRAVQFSPLSIHSRGAYEAALFGWAVLLCFSAAALLFSVTTMTEIREAIGKLEQAVFKKERISLGVSLMLGFLPRFFELWETANTAWKARCGKRGIRAIIVLVPLLTEKMIETAADTAQALEARGLEL